MVVEDSSVTAVTEFSHDHSSTKLIRLPRILFEGGPTEWLKGYEICCDANDKGKEVSYHPCWRKQWLLG